MDWMERGYVESTGWYRMHIGYDATKTRVHCEIDTTTGEAWLVRLDSIRFEIPLLKGVDQ